MGVIRFDVPQMLCAQLSARGRDLREKKSEMDGFCGEKAGRFACHLSRSVWPVPPERLFPARVFGRTPGALRGQQVTGQQCCNLSLTTQKANLDKLGLDPVQRQ